MMILHFATSVACEGPILLERYRRFNVQPVYHAIPCCVFGVYFHSYLREAYYHILRGRNTRKQQVKNRGYGKFSLRTVPNFPFAIIYGRPGWTMVVLNAGEGRIGS